MTRSELIEALNQRFPRLTQAEAAAAVAAMLAAVEETLASGGRVEVRGFGSFSIYVQPPRLGRNPKTGESVAVPSKKKVHFKAGLALRERVDSACGTRAPSRRL